MTKILNELLPGLISSLIGGGFTLLASWYSWALQKNAMDDSTDPLFQFVNFNHIFYHKQKNDEDKIKRSIDLFWLSVILILTVVMSVYLAETYEYQLAKDNYIYLYIVPLIILQTYFLINYFYYKYKTHKASDLGTLLFTTLALIFSFIAAPIIAFIIAYIRYNQIKLNLQLEEIAIKMKKQNLENEKISEITGLELRKIENL